MSISLPTYKLRETPLLGRRQRVLAIVSTGLRREFRRPAAIFAIGVGSVITTVTSIVLLLLAPLLLPGQRLDLSFFFLPVSSPTILFFVTLMASVVGAGLISDDLDSMAISLYLSRPISHGDYVLAKAAILGTLVATIAILPLMITAIVAGLLGLFPWDVVLPAIGVSIAVGILLTAFYTTITLFLSSMTRRKAYAAAGVFAITFGLTVPVEVLASQGSIGNPVLLYLSPWDNFLAVARVAFGAAPAPIDWSASLGILLLIMVLAGLVTNARMRSMEVVAG